MKPINARIHVFARSIRGQVEPLQFIYKNRRFSVRAILSSKIAGSARSTFYTFTVELIPEGKCKLQFELQTGEWMLLKGDSTIQQLD